MAAALLVLALLDERERRKKMIPRRLFTHRLPAFDLADSTFQSLFRLDKRSVIFITDKIKDFMLPSRTPADLRVLVALRFFATGHPPSSIANDEFLQIREESVSRCITEISTLIARHLTQECIKFPRNDEDLASIKEKFYRISRFPGVIGVIGCTHVAIVSLPSSDASAYSYINRKGITSISVQLIIDADLQILGVNARFPGSVYGAFIWKASLARDHISRIKNGWLLGDSGYPLEPWLMTPFHKPEPGSVEEGFNRKHSLTRSCVERCNVLLKTRFKCLLTDNVLQYPPSVAGNIVNTCVVLHNLCVKSNIQLESDSEYNLGKGDQMFRAFLPNSGTSVVKKRRYELALSMFQDNVS